MAIIHFPASRSTAARSVGAPHDRSPRPWLAARPELLASAQARPACRGSITVEAPIALGARLRITAWPRHHTTSRRSARSATASTTSQGHSAGTPYEED
jgi:hypothetical protein